MFYEPDKDDHGLPFNPYKSIVVPRPIGWVSTISRDGIVNLAPFSQFNNLAYDPPYVMFSANSFPESGRRKDSVKNATDTGEFVVNMATYALREAVNITSQFVPPEIDEAALAGLEMIGSRIVKPPRVAASPVHLECKFHSSTALPARTLDGVHHVVIGRVVGVHIRDDALTHWHGLHHGLDNPNWTTFKRHRAAWEAYSREPGRPEILNCNPASALDCFPKYTLEWLEVAA